MRARTLILLLVALLGLVPAALPGVVTGGCGTGDGCCCAPPDGPTLDNGSCACGAPTSPARSAPDQAPLVLEGHPLQAPEALPTARAPAARGAARRTPADRHGPAAATTRSVLGVWLI